MTNTRSIGTLFILITLAFHSFIGETALAESTSRPSADNAAALADLREFLFNPTARKDFSNGKSDATSANNFLEAFPPWAQNELLDIVMMIVTESMEGSSKHVDAYKNGGVQGATASFSPAVRARVDAFIQRLSTDPTFNTPANLQKLKTLLPAISGRST